MAVSHIKQNHFMIISIILVCALALFGYILGASVFYLRAGFFEFIGWHYIVPTTMEEIAFLGAVSCSGGLLFQKIQLCYKEEIDDSVKKSIKLTINTSIFIFISLGMIIALLSQGAHWKDETMNSCAILSTGQRVSISTKPLFAYDFPKNWNTGETSVKYFFSSKEMSENLAMMNTKVINIINQPCESITGIINY